ncbi:16469_t:CDS:1, partial [Racocetra persica]
VHCFRRRISYTPYAVKKAKLGELALRGSSIWSIRAPVATGLAYG